MYAAFLSGITIIEGVSGFIKGNAHIVRDFLASTILIAMLGMNHHAVAKARQERDQQFNYGYQRLSLMAAFINTIYIMTKSLFSFMETIHQMIEQWEIYSREAGLHHKYSDPVLEKVHQYHEGVQH